MSPIKNGLIYAALRKTLAGKVLKAKGLTPNEKKQIYELLTGNTPTMRGKGRPSKEPRNMALAIDVMVNKLFNEEKGSLVPIAHAYGVIPSTQDSNPEYKAFSAGCNALRLLAEEGLAAFDEYGLVVDDPKLIKLRAIFGEYLELIARYGRTVGKK